MSDIKTKEINQNFLTLKKLIKRLGKDLEARETIIGSKAGVKKPALHIYGKKEVSVSGRKAQKTYLAGIIQQKHFVGFYFMPIYSHRGKFQVKNEELRQTLTGKSCFNVRVLTPEVLKELEDMMRKGIEIYKNEGWI